MVKKYIEDPNKSWEEKYIELEQHHIEETTYLVSKLEELRSAIKDHREKTGHEMCWENDEELWQVLGDNIEIDHTPPNWCEFMERCVAYRKSKDK